MSTLNSALSLILLNIIIYIILIINIFLVFFLHDMRYFRTLNELKNLNSNQYVLVCTVLVFLSLAGMPPLLGFFGKFLTALFFLNKQQFLIFFLFVFFNFFVIYFYILNIRFLLTKSTKTFFFVKNFTVYYNFNIVTLLLFFTILNVFGIFFLNDLIIFLNFICSF